MPIRYERDDRRRRINILSAGQVTTAQVLATLDRQAAEGAWSYGVLYDARASASMPTGDDLRAALLRVGELTSLQVKVFTSPADAERWLDECAASA